MVRRVSHMLRMWIWTKFTFSPLSRRLYSLFSSLLESLSTRHSFMYADAQRLASFCNAWSAKWSVQIVRISSPSHASNSYSIVEPNTGLSARYCSIEYRFVIFDASSWIRPNDELHAATVSNSVRDIRTRYSRTFSEMSQSKLSSISEIAKNICFGAYSRSTYVMILLCIYLI